MSDALTNFHSRIMHLAPQFVDNFGTGFSGMTGGAAGIIGGTTTGTDLTQALQILTMKFVQAYRKPDVSNEELTQAAKKIEGIILTIQTVSALTENEAKSLIDELYDVIEERK